MIGTVYRPSYSSVNECNEINRENKLFNFVKMVRFRDSTSNEEQIPCEVAPGGGGGVLPFEKARDGLVSFRGANHRFWTHLGCSGQNATIFICHGVALKLMRNKCCLSFRGQIMLLLCPGWSLRGFIQSSQ